MSKTHGRARPAALLLLLTMLGGAALTGCGGAGTSGLNASARTDDTSRRAGGASAPSEGQNGRFGLFATAVGESGKYDHVWVTIQRIELIDVMEKPVIVFDDADGVTLDLVHLRGGVGGNRFALLDIAAAPSGRSYQRVRLSFTRSFQLFEKGAAVGQMMPLSDTLARDDQERPALSFPLNKPRDLGGGKENVVVSFDLAKLEVKEGRVIPALAEGTQDGLPNPARQEPATFTGTLSEINRAGKETTFTLTLAPNRTVTVQASDATIYYNDGAAPSPALGDGKRVAVRGVLAADSKRVLAQQVEVYADAKPATVSATLRGVVSSADPASGTLTVAATQVEGIVPTLTAVTVMLTPDAVLHSSGGLLLTRDQFFGSLSAGRGTLAVVEGAYEPVTGVMKATQAKIENAIFAPAHEVEVEGTPKDVDATAARLTVGEATEWQGISLGVSGKEGATAGIPIVTTAATMFRDENGQYLASASFFAAAAGNKSVRAAGIYADGKLTATRLDLTLSAPKPEAKSEGEAGTAKPADGKGPASLDKPDVPKTDDTTKPETPPTKPNPPASPPASPRPDEA
jgi:hypothetical protein